MNHCYRKLAYGEYELRNKRTRIILGYIHTRVPAAGGRSSIMRVQRLGSDQLEGAFKTRGEAREYLEALHAD